MVQFRGSTIVFDDQMDHHIHPFSAFNQSLSSDVILLSSGASGSNNSSSNNNSSSSSNSKNDSKGTTSDGRKKTKWNGYGNQREVNLDLSRT